MTRLSKLINPNAFKCYSQLRNCSSRAATTVSLFNKYQLSSSMDVKQQYPSINRRNFHSSVRFYQQQEKEHATTAGGSNEKTVGTPEKFEFLAETKQLLNIVAKSLYSEKEVFIRELVSNASDALEKLKYAQLIGEIPNDAAAAAGTTAVPFEIQINANDMNNTLTIQDTGVGMTKAELIQNLGTIAHSGSKAFLEKLAQDSSGSSTKNIIGQFGVGFYSAFMVADRVQVFSQSSKPGEKAFEWTSTG